MLSFLLLAQVSDTTEIIKITTPQNFPIVISLLLLLAVLLGVGWTAKWFTQSGLKEIKEVFGSLKTSIERLESSQREEARETRRAQQEEAEKTRKVLYDLRDSFLQFCYKTGNDEIADKIIEDNRKKYDNSAIPIGKAS